jgi:hypothetical protein
MQQTYNLAGCWSIDEVYSQPTVKSEDTQSKGAKAPIATERRGRRQLFLPSVNDFHMMFRFSVLLLQCAHLSCPPPHTVMVKCSILLYKQVPLVVCVRPIHLDGSFLSLSRLCFLIWCHTQLSAFQIGLSDLSAICATGACLSYTICTNTSTLFMLTRRCATTGTTSHRCTSDHPLGRFS